MESPPRRFALPFVLPIVSFALAIASGSILLWFAGTPGVHVAYTDAFFTATSAVCVTGLASVDIGSTFSAWGLATILVLMQLGGLGITAYSTLLFFLISKRISLLNRFSVSEALLNDPTFSLSRFLKRVVVIIFVCELVGAILIFVFSPARISFFTAVFLAVSAFCNAGFSPLPDNLVSLQQNVCVNVVILFLIVSGGIGFVVLDELVGKSSCVIRFFTSPSESKLRKIFYLSPYAKLVLQTTFFLVFGGAAVIFLAEYFANDSDASSLSEMILPAIFQSITARTAGFNTVSISAMTDVSLLTLIFLMFVGGAPGSCAGGIKITTFRVLIAFALSQLRGSAQVLVDGKAVGAKILNKVFILLTFSVMTITSASFALILIEGGASPHGKTAFQALDLVFEVVSASSTVGLSLDVTPHLSDAGKMLECLLMFVGRLGPIWIITAVQQFQTGRRYKYPERNLPIG